MLVRLGLAGPNKLEHLQIKLHNHLDLPLTHEQWQIKVYRDSLQKTRNNPGGDCYWFDSHLPFYEKDNLVNKPRNFNSSPLKNDGVGKMILFFLGWYTNSWGVLIELNRFQLIRHLGTFNRMQYISPKK